MELKLLLKPQEAAAALGVSRTKVYELIARGPTGGGIPSIKCGASTRVPIDALREWIESRLEPAGGSR